VTTHTAVDVLVDDTGRLGPLAYIVPDGIVVQPGDAVTVPFGKSQRHGLVLGPAATPEKATRGILLRLGERVDPLDMSLAFSLAEKHFAAPYQVAARLSPAAGRNSAPIDPGPLRLVARPKDLSLPVPPRNWRERTYLRPPCADPARIGALEALRLSAGGQVLVVCPTVALVERTLAEFESGAARLDSKARAGAWNGWRSGSVAVGIGTRASALYSASTLAGIVVLEEEHPGHLESSLPYTHSRDVARLRASAHSIPLTLVSASPTASGMHGSKVLTIPSATSLWPRVRLYDKNDIHPSMRQIPPALLAAVGKSTIPVVALCETRQSRRVCVRCGDARPCVSCSSFCKHPELTPCPRCSSKGIRWSGFDAARIRQTLVGAEPLTLAELSALPPASRTVVVLSGDALLSLPGLAPLHGSASSFTRLAEAAGPGGSLLIPTSYPDHPVLRALAGRDLTPVLREVWSSARAEGMPPFGHLVTVRLGWKRPPRTSDWPGTVLGPRRVAGEWEVLVQVSSADLPLLRSHLEAVRRRGKVRITLQ
jgi:primosomal protein N'